MKKIFKFIIWSFVGVVLLVDVALTVYLLNYNKYNVSVFGKKSIIVMTKKIEDYEKGDLLIVTKNDNSELLLGDHVFFYDTVSKESVVNYGKINQVNKEEGMESTFMMSNNYMLADENIIGKGETTKVYSGLGSILGFFTSKWVFLIAIILPISALFIYQFYLLLLELKKAKK